MLKDALESRRLAAKAKAAGYVRAEDTAVAIWQMQQMQKMLTRELRVR